MVCRHKWLNVAVLCSLLSSRRRQNISASAHAFDFIVILLYKQERVYVLESKCNFQLF